MENLSQMTGWSKESVEALGMTASIASTFSGIGKSKGGSQSLNHLQGKKKNPVELEFGGTGTTTVTYPGGISFKVNQPAHLSAVEKYTQQKGITGGHNADAFYSAANQNGVKIVSQKSTGVNGITHIKYQIPSKDAAGNITGYKNVVLEKTIYDPKIFTDSKILNLGQQAAANGYKSAMSSGAREYTASAGGVDFRVYLDSKTGTVTNFFPVTK